MIEKNFLEVNLKWLKKLIKYLILVKFSFIPYYYNIKSWIKNIKKKKYFIKNYGLYQVLLYFYDYKINKKYKIIILENFGKEKFIFEF